MRRKHFLCSQFKLDLCTRTRRTFKSKNSGWLQTVKLKYYWVLKNNSAVLSLCIQSPRKIILHFRSAFFSGNNTACHSQVIDQTCIKYFPFYFSFRRTGVLHALKSHTIHKPLPNWYQNKWISWIKTKQRLLGEDNNKTSKNRKIEIVAIRTSQRLQETSGGTTGIGYVQCMIINIIHHLWDKQTCLLNIHWFPEVRVNTGTGRSHIYRNFLAGYATIIGCNRVADASTVNRYANEAQFVPSFTAKQLHITPGAVFPNAIIQNNRYEIIVL